MSASLAAKRKARYEFDTLLEHVFYFHNVPEDV